MLLLPMSGCASPSAKAPKAHRFTTALYCELADLEADEYDEMKSGFGPAASDPPQYRRGRSCILHNLVPAGTGIQALVSVEVVAGQSRQLRGRQERAWPRSRRNPVMSWLASPRLARDARLLWVMMRCLVQGGHPRTKRKGSDRLCRSLRDRARVGSPFLFRQARTDIGVQGPDEKYGTAEKVGNNLPHTVGVDISKASVDFHA